MSAIHISRVSKRYRGSIRALQNVSIDVEPGEVYGLLGRNGAGKTTLVKVILDLVRASSGHVLILGQPATSASARLPVGYLPEDHRFLEYQTAATALDFYARLSRLPQTARRRRIPELLEMVDLSRARSQRVRGFSKGMKQRLGLAQALIHDPEILFLDEPTDGVDPVGRHQVRAILERLRDQGKTIFLNSHLLSEVERVCARIGILERGKLIREGTMDELTRAENIFVIRTREPVAEVVLNELELCSQSVQRNGLELELTLKKSDGIDQVIDLLRGSEIGILEVRSKQNTLEDAFLATLSDQEPQSQ